MRRVFVPGTSRHLLSGRIGRTRWFITANWPLSLIERDNVITEVGAQDFAFCLSCALLQIWAGPETPTEESPPPPLLSSLQKAFSQTPSFSFALSCCVSLSVTAPDGLLFSGCSLTSILRVTSFFFFFLPLWIYPQRILWALWTLPSFNSASSQPCEFDELPWSCHLQQMDSFSSFFSHRCMLSLGAMLSKACVCSCSCWLSLICSEIRLWISMSGSFVIQWFWKLCSC